MRAPRKGGAACFACSTFLCSSRDCFMLALFTLYFLDTCACIRGTRPAMPASSSRRTASRCPTRPRSKIHRLVSGQKTGARAPVFVCPESCAACGRSGASSPLRVYRAAGCFAGAARRSAASPGFWSGCREPGRRVFSFVHALHGEGGWGPSTKVIAGLGFGSKPVQCAAEWCRMSPAKMERCRSFFFLAIKQAFTLHGGLLTCWHAYCCNDL